MNRRGFVGMLVGLGGLFLPAKSLFANNIDTLSSEELGVEILSRKQYSVRIFLHKPISSSSFRINSISKQLERFGLSTTHYYDFLQLYRTDQNNGSVSFIFKNHNEPNGQRWQHPTSNMKYIAIDPAEDSYENDWLFYEHHGDDRWSRIANKTVMPWIKGV